MEPEKVRPLIHALSVYLRSHPQMVIVHGGGKEISAMSSRLGIKTRFVGGRRFTDQQTMEVVEMILSGKVNPTLVSHLNRLKISAIGLSGRDAGLVQATRIKSLGFVGAPSKICAKLIRSFLSKGLVPVFSSIAFDEDGSALNVNADEMASAIASALKADRLVLFTDVPGILDPSGKTIHRLTPGEGKNLIQKKIITGGMIPKVHSSFNALKKGIREIWILQGSLPLRNARGTLLTRTSRPARHPFAK